MSKLSRVGRYGFPAYYCDKLCYPTPPDKKAEGMVMKCPKSYFYFC